ncbi:MAG: DUF3450 domain-containing protein [Campylobacterota bacterium]|nr:DUF3450 domain-containing protein [Campylobacterota bacterium]
MKYIFLSIISSHILLFAAADVDIMVKKVDTAHKQSAISQKNIDAYAEQRETLYDKYVALQKELEAQKIYNRQLELITATQKSKIPVLKQQLLDIEVTQKKIIPLMFEMVETLDTFVAVDSPFLLQERSGRVANLKSYLSNPDITLSEQFRMIFESYKIEYNYARTLEVYRSQLDPKDSQSKTVDFLRVGRVGLYYQSLDREESALYDIENKKWVRLDNSYNSVVLKAIKMARKKIAPDFLTLPVLASKGSK